MVTDFICRSCILLSKSN